MYILGTPLGWVMSFIYNIVHNYGWALIIFIVLTRVVQFPLGIKQQKSTARMAYIQPKLKALQKQFAKNKDRLNEEMMKLYEQEGISPTAGCLPMLITFLLLFGIIDVIYNPLVHILHIDSSILKEATTLIGNLGGGAPQLNLISAIQGNANVSAELAALVPQLKEIFGPELFTQIQNFNMSFLGLNLGDIPNAVWGITIIVPILSFVTQILSTLITMKIQSQNGQQMQGAMKWTMLLMPLMSLWFAFTLPVGVGLYWTVSNVLIIAQTLILAKMYPPEKVAKMNDKNAEKNREKLRKKREKMEMYTQQINEKNKLAVQKMEKPRLSSEEEAKQKDDAKRRLAEARKRMAEKYGDEYKED